MNCRDLDAKWGTVDISEKIMETCWQALVDSIEFKLNTCNKKNSGSCFSAHQTEKIVANIGGVAEAAKITSAGATDTQKAAEELTHLANELQKIVNEA